MDRDRELKWKIIKMLSVGANLPPGPHHIDVLHDDNCPAIKTGSLTDCRCQPEFKLRQTKEKMDS